MLPTIQARYGVMALKSEQDTSGIRAGSTASGYGASGISKAIGTFLRWCGSAGVAVMVIETFIALGVLGAAIAQASLIYKVEQLEDRLDAMEENND